MAISPRTEAHGDLATMPTSSLSVVGFAGIATAKGLSDQDVRVTIIDQHNFHTFQPLLYQVATAGLEPADVAYPIRTIFGSARNVRFRHGRVRAVDHSRGVVILDDGAEITFDHLVVATGAIAAYFACPAPSSSHCRSTRWPTRADFAIDCCRHSSGPTSRPTANAWV
jgi:NAD(P)H-nitrite reductase large subunit